MVETTKAKPPHRFTIQCESCDGDGQRDDAPEARGEEWRPVWTGGGDFASECYVDKCAEGRVPCVCQVSHVEGCVPVPYAGPEAPEAYDISLACDAKDIATVPGWVECDCDADKEYTRECEVCDGTGYVDDRCECGNVLADRSTAYVGDGEVKCPSCVDRSCPDCEGIGEIPIPETIPTPGARIPLARHWTVVERSCSMCGGSPHNYDDRKDGYGNTWLVVRASLCDAEGTYYAALCAGEGDACLDEILAQQGEVPEKTADKLAALVEVMPEEWADGIESEMGGR